VGGILPREVKEGPLDNLVAEMLERPMSRRKLLARGRDLGLTMAASSFLTACGSAVAAHQVAGTPTASDPPPPKYLVMLIIDACRHDYLSYGNLPNITQLMGSGTYYDRAWVGQLEAVTPASHATIGSGCFPSNDGGILGFWWKDPATGTTFNSVDLKGTDPDSLAVIMANAGVPTMAEFLKRHDSRAKVYAASGQKFYAADAAGGPDADYISYYHVTSNGGWGPTCIDGHELPADLLNKPGTSSPNWQTQKPAVSDALVGNLALDVIKQEAPRIVIMNLPEMDWPVAHKYGGPRCKGYVTLLMENADRILGKLMDQYRSAGIYDETVFMVLGDHGVTPLELFVNSSDIRAVMNTIDTVVSFDSHTGAFGWLADSANSAAAATAIENSAAATNVSAVYYVDESSGKKLYRPAPNTARATHDTLGKAYQYLLHTVAGDNAPHVACFFPERTGTLHSGGWLTPWLGDHGGASWGSQAVPLILSGPGVRKGFVSHFPARLVDLAPTAMRLLGVPYPGTDGVVLADAMTSPARRDSALQGQVAKWLVPYAGALRVQSAREAAGLPALTPIPFTGSNNLATPGARY
jgi:predicted AlkP superfamily pyrophosphatase or phosphodiesterase